MSTYHLRRVATLVEVQVAMIAVSAADAVTVTTAVTMKEGKSSQLTGEIVYSALGDADYRMELQEERVEQFVLLQHLHSGFHLL